MNNISISTREQYVNLLTDMSTDKQFAGLQQTVFPEALTWDDYVSELNQVTKDDPKLKQLIRQKKQEDLISNVTLDKIMSSGFTEAKKAIDQMTIAKRIQMLSDVYEYRDYLYTSMSRYGTEGLSKDEQLSDSEFRTLLGRVKHLEILQNWLYGIV